MSIQSSEIDLDDQTEPQTPEKEHFLVTLEDSDEKELQEALSKVYPGEFKGYAIVLVVLLGLLCVLPPIVGFFFHVEGTSGWAVLMGFMSLFAFLPGTLILWLMYWFKEKDKASFSGIAKFILIGFLLIIPVFIVEFIEIVPWGAARVGSVFSEKNELGISDIEIGFIFYFSFVTAALTEETAKFLSCFLLKTHEPTITKPYTVVILVTSSALGFAILENYGYILQNAMTGDILMTFLAVLTRALLSVPLHTVTGTLIGCDMAKQHFLGDITFKFYLSTIWLPILIHGFFDVLAFLGSFGIFWFYVGNVVLVVGGVILCYQRIQQVKKITLPVEEPKRYQFDCDSIKSSINSCLF